VTHPFLPAVVLNPSDFNFVAVIQRHQENVHVSAPSLFLCYSHQDHYLKDRLLAQLGVLQSQGLLDVWTDDRIQTGDRWRDEIVRAMDDASIAVLLVSASFLNSRFVRDVETPRILERRIGEGMRVLPLVVRPCAWQSVGWLERLQVRDLARPGAAAELDAAFAEIVREVHQLLAPRPPEAARPARKCLPPPPDRITLSRLPVTGGKVFGRDPEVHALHEAWRRAETHVVSVVGWGGAGKSALLKRWLQEMESDGYGCAERVYAWSFARQGAGEMPSSSDGFVSAALAWFGDPDPAGGSAREKGERLAYRVRAERTLLLLDGLEPLQVPSGPEAGRLKDEALQALLRELAAANTGGLCVVTSRIPVADLLDFEPEAARRVELPHLSPTVGAQVLRAHGATGSDEELMAASREYGGHPLALVLLAGYLRDVFGGDIAQRGAIQLRDAGNQAERVMTAYEGWFGEGPELELLRLLGLFDRPADARAVAALRAPPLIPGLTDTLHRLPAPKWRQLVAQLRRTGLVAGEDPAEPGTLDVHPLVREHFRAQLRERDPAAWREGNGRLYEHFRDAAPPLPDTLAEMEPLFRAVAHGCDAGRHRDALHEVYLPRIMRGEVGYAARRLGAYGALLSALAHFCHEGDWARPVDPVPPEVQGLEPEEQLAVLTQAGLFLTAQQGYVSNEKRACYDTVRRLATRLGQPLHLYQALVAQHREWLVTREFDATLQLADEVFALARQHDHPALLVGARRAQATTRFFMGRLAEAQALAREGVRIWDEGGSARPVDELYLPVVSCRMVDALVLWHQGFPERARRGVDETLRAIRALGDLNLLAAPGLLFSVYLEHGRRVPEAMLAAAEELVRVSSAQGFRFWQAGGVTAYGWALGMMGEPERGLATMEKGLQQFTALGISMNLLYSLSMQAELLDHMGRHAEALATVERALALAERRSEGRWMAELHRLRGELLLRTGAPPEAALAALARAREVAAEQGARMLELRALCSLARADSAGARPALAALYAGFTEGWDEVDLRDARALLEEAGA
jgi:tetratricopeptide (TPR) repeat protein